MESLKKRIKRKMLQCSHFPLTKTIVFESSPNYSCNTYPVFCYMKEHYPQFRYIWAVNHQENVKLPAGADGWYCYDAKGFWQKWRRFYYSWTSKALISCNRALEKHTKNQLAVFLCHGSKTKKTRGVYELSANLDYVNVQSHFFDDIITYEYNCKKESLVYLGYPRCDYLFRPDFDRMNHAIFSGACKQYMIWLPTMRVYRVQSDGVPQRVDTEDRRYDQFGIPLIDSKEDLVKFDQFLEKLECKIVFKPHPAQDVHSLINAKLRNFYIINDNQLADKQIQLYELIAASSALITDYSSVFFDYLLLDKPIATTTDDIEGWKKKRGFAFDVEAMYNRATVRIPTVRALMTFIEDTLAGKDDCRDGRAEIRSQTNMWCDPNATQRTTRFIMEHLRAGGLENRYEEV